MTVHDSQEQPPAYLIPAPGRRVTPTGRLVTSAAPGSDEWHLARAGGLTATDVPKLLGVSQYGTALDVWAVKTGRVEPDEAGEAAQWGNLLEDVIAREAARRLGVRVRSVGVLAHDEHPWRRASLDRLVVGPCCGGRGAVEVKNRSAYVKDRWRSDVPDDVLAQVVWQMHVSGVDHVHVAVLHGGNTLELHALHRTELADVERLTVDAAQDLWHHVVTDTQPRVDPTAGLIASLERLFTHRDGTVVGDEAAVALRQQYLTAQRDAAAADRAKKDVQAALLLYLGAAKDVVDPDGARMWGTTPVRQIDSDRAFTEHHDLWVEAATCGLVDPVIDSTAVRDEQPELWARFDAAGLITTTHRFQPPKAAKPTKET